MNEELGLSPRATSATGPGRTGYATGRADRELRAALETIRRLTDALVTDHLTAEQRFQVELIRAAGHRIAACTQGAGGLGGVGAPVRGAPVRDAPELDGTGLTSVRIDHLIDDVLSHGARLAARRSVALVRGMSCGGAVAADPAGLRLVIWNLVANAITYNYTRGLVAVSSSERPAGYVRVAVADTGRGVDARRRGSLFVPTCEPAWSQRDHLGLPLSRRLIEAMGGAMGFESIVGIGSTFWVELPRAEVAAEGRGPAEAPANGSAVEPGVPAVGTLVTEAGGAGGADAS